MTSARFGSGALLATALASITIGLALGSVFSPSAPQPEATAPVERVPVSKGPGTTEKRVQMTGAEDGGERAVATAQPAAAVKVSPQRLAAATASIANPGLVAAAEGARSIPGTVLDEDGEPLAGVAIVATTRYSYLSNVSSSGKVGRDAPAVKSLEENLEDAAEKWANSQSNRYLATSNAVGAFEVASLPEGNFDLRAYKEGWRITAEDQFDVATGTTISFKAQVVRTLTLDVRMPDGSAATDVVVQYVVDENDRFMYWSSEEPTLRFSQNTFEMTVYSHVIGNGYLRENPAAKYASKSTPIQLDELGEGPLVIQLLAQNGVNGTITWEWGEPDRNYSQVHAIRIKTEADFNPKEEIENNYRVQKRDGKFTIGNLEPGLYVIALKDQLHGGTGLLAYEFLTLTDEIETVDLFVKAPTSAGNLIVHCIDQGGNPIDDVEFAYSQSTGRSSRSGGAQAMISPDGSYWLPTSEFEEFDYDSWPDGAEISLTLTSKSHGSHVVELSSGKREITVTFERPLTLTVRISGYEDHPDKSRMHVNIAAPPGDSGRARSVARSDRMGRRGGDSGISQQGVVTFPSLAPGDWTVELVGPSGTVIDSVAASLGSADAEVQLRAPALYNLSVHAPSLENRAYLRIANIDSPNDFAFGSSERLNTEKRCVFKGLLAGTYTLSGNGASVPMEVQVPGPEVIFEAKEPNAVKVIIMDQAGSLYQAGFRNLDVIVAVGGTEIADMPSIQVAFMGLMGSEAQVTVRRGSERIKLTMVPIDQSQNGMAKIGGTFQPAFE